MIDRDGYRPNVGIVLCNAKNQVFWGKRVREHAWQFPQGGIKHGENPEAAMFRELKEEVGLEPQHVLILGRTRDWVVIYYAGGDHAEAQCTVVTETRGALRGRRVVRGREEECRALYASATQRARPPGSGATG